ncbi:protein ACCELERATED CELL DEATH 6-like [Solanum tuberosum]|uniref:protein ACCELERATED CELL DEATH 6-like n=1 Tax=Solanum tuberosum TaxID=4113 RepID=UPI00073A2812|nr:PREDICTED: protein ACCELERATED CELL DEATH 6-like [Solanum tuberosum]
MVQRDNSLAYTRACKENDWTTSIHIAASEGYVDVINAVSEQCPDYWEMLNSSGQNALHVAISNDKSRVVRLLLNDKESHNLIDEADNDGNTPLQLLASSKYLYVPLQLIGHPHTKKMLFNKENQTPLDIEKSGTETTAVEKYLFKQNLQYGRSGRRHFEIKKKQKMQEQEDEMESSENKAKNDKKSELENIMAATEIHLVVATLLVTVTFAVGFMLPGGFESDPSGPYKGLVILARNTAFRAFVVSDAIAFTCSAGAVFSYFFIAANATATTKIKIMRVLFNKAMLLQLFAMSAVVITFVTGMYATLAHSVGLAITVVVIDCMSFLVYALLLCAFN